MAALPSRAWDGASRQFPAIGKAGTMIGMLGVLAEYERRAEPYRRVAVGPWMVELVQQYRNPPPPHRARLALPAAALFICGLLATWLLRLDAMAYPVEPGQRQALDLCSRENPTFIRFFASERESCYSRLRPVLRRGD